LTVAEIAKRQTQLLAEMDQLDEQLKLLAKADDGTT
jgi:hypothetical protein